MVKSSEYMRKYREKNRKKEINTDNGGLTTDEQNQIDMRGGINGAVGGFELNGDYLHVPEWFSDKENTARNGLSVKRETDKAVLLEGIDIADSGTIKTEFWVPKSILQTTKEYAAGLVSSQKRYRTNAKYTNYLKGLAQSNGVKIGNAKSWESIQKKLAKNGVDFVDRDKYEG